MPKVLIFAIHNTEAWWQYLGSKLEFAEAIVVSDVRGRGQACIVDDFYQSMRTGDPIRTARTMFGEDGCADIIRRCRVLRSLKRNRALRMIGGMALALEKVLDLYQPDLALSLTIDRYVTDIFGRLAQRRGIELLEMTTSIVPEEVMFLRRGRLIQLWEPSDAEVNARTDVLYQPDFAPTYVRNLRRFSRRRYWSTVGYSELRGACFNVLRFLKRDRDNFQYLEAQTNLNYKVGRRDHAVPGFINPDWERRLADCPRAKRVFLGLQLFPEASMDYWLNDPAMLRHDDVVYQYCSVLEAGGYQVFVKDHPLQFGFRQRTLLERLMRLRSVTLVPYDVPAPVLIGATGVSVTFTGTIGFQAALAGLCSVVSEPYYGTREHYLHVRKATEIEAIVERIEKWRPPGDMPAARREMVRHLTKGSVPGDYSSWLKFDPASSEAVRRAVTLVDSLNTYLPRFLSVRTLHQAAEPATACTAA